MEDDLSIHDPELPSDSADSIIQKKHALMLERLANRHQTRLENSTTRQSESDSTSSFLSRFSDCKRSIESQLARCRLSLPDPNKLKCEVEKISGSISDIEKLVAESSYFLPSYEIRSSLKSISDLKQSLETLNSDLLPKKKFSFKNKAAKKDPIVEVRNTEIRNPHGQTPEKEKSTFIVPDSPGLRNKGSEILVKNFKGLEIGEFTISDLDSCEVRLIGCVRALFVHKLKNCKVYTGPVMGSVLIDEVENCVFIVASHQIRIHNAKESCFYLRVRSRPIIEDSSRVQFAPYCLSYQGIEEGLTDANLSEETGNWENVDDFRWLRAVHSPNWSILPENERIGIIRISNSEEGFLGS